MEPDIADLIAQGLAKDKGMEVVIRGQTLRGIKDEADEEGATMTLLKAGRKETPAKTMPLSDVDVAVTNTRKALCKNFPEIINQFVRAGLQNPHLAQVAADRSATAGKKLMQATRGQTKPGWVTGTTVDDTPYSKQVNLEDLFSALDVVQPDPKIRFELFEREYFEEDHIAGTCLSRIGVAVTKRGLKIARISGENDLGPAADNDASEVQDLTDWIENCNSIRTFKSIIQRVVVAFMATGNAYLEVIRDTVGDPAALPAGLEVTITSTMRVIRGHRGFAQWIAGEFHWFNNYTPQLDDRLAGEQLWEGYWAKRGIDVHAPEFLTSPWCHTLSSAMPPGTWNPHLTEMIHWADLSLTSKYYGFPRDYRLSKLHALLQTSLDYNIGLQRNNRVQPFLLYFHGKLDENRRADLENYLQTIRGAENFGSVPIFEGGSVASGPVQGSGRGPKGSIEIVKITDEQKDGVFLELWKILRQDIAMHYGFPLDLLTTESSNRATIEVAEELFNDWTVNELHEMMEATLLKLTKEDLGFLARCIMFQDLDTTDSLQRAQEAQIWHDTGNLNPNESRQKYLNMGPREGGDEYYDFNKDQAVPESQLGGTATAPKAPKATPPSKPPKAPASSPKGSSRVRNAIKTAVGQHPAKAA